MSCTRSKLVAQAQKWVGLKESDGSFKVIIDTYNSHKPLARGYRLKYTDAWCSGFASAVAIACGATDIIPTEVGCSKHIDLFKKMNCWVEDDAYVPSPGDYIFYDWQDSGAGDNKGGSDHVGIVEKVENGSITVIEGNYNQAVKRRTLKVNGKYIRGYGVPKYDAEEKTQASTENEPGAVGGLYYYAPMEGTYAVTENAGLNVRRGAGTSAQKIVAIPRGTKVTCHGYYGIDQGVKWLHIQFTYNGKKYTGFAHSGYLKK